MNIKDMYPVHTERAVRLLEKEGANFNTLQFTLRISPSTISRILKFLVKAGFLKPEIVERKDHGLKKLYILTPLGRKAAKLFRTIQESKDKIMALVDG